MKKTLLLLVIIIIIMLIMLTSCSLGGSQMKKSFFQDDRVIANNTFDMLLNALQSNDTAALKSLFAKKAIEDVEDFEAIANDLFNYLQGDLVSYDDWGGAVACEGFRENGQEWYTIQPTYDVKTSEQEYRLAFKMFTVNDFEPDKVGIWSLYIIKMSDDTDQRCAYRGDGKWSPGITIGKTGDGSLY